MPNPKHTIRTLFSINVFFPPPSFIKICDVADKMDINVDEIYLELSKPKLKLANFIPGCLHQIMAGPVIMAPWETLI